MDKVVVIIVIVIILLGAGFWAWQSGVFSGPAKPVAIPEGIILFYGNGCPHCEIVDDFVLQNKIEEKVKFTKLEVWYNKDNQSIISQVAQKCGITADSVGVPFLYDGVKCYEGDIDVINFFKNASGIQ
jgi:hypothetical protein